jgi:hypothetical protein
MPNAYSFRVGAGVSRNEPETLQMDEDQKPRATPGQGSAFQLRAIVSWPVAQSDPLARPAAQSRLERRPGPLSSLTFSLSAVH